MSITTLKMVLLSAASVMMSQQVFASAIIIDGTASANLSAIKTNMGFVAPGKKSDTPIDDPYPKGNAININTFQVLTRDTSNPDNTSPPPPHQLKLTIGNNDGVINANNKYDNNGILIPEANPLDYFSNGKHLFDIDRFRDAANWLSSAGNVSPDTDVAAKTYGTITFRDFLENIAANKTMYGLVRVLIPLQKNGNTYGFCTASTPVPNPQTNPGEKGPGCSCAPNGGLDIRPSTLCGNINITASNAIKVKGSLMWDFVDHLTGEPIALGELPEHPRDLYFKVEIPIWVNWSDDVTNAQGEVDFQKFTDRLDLINSKTASLSAGTITTTTLSISKSEIPQVSKQAYNHQKSGDSSSTDFDDDFADMSLPNKYHLLMPSGYADGWAEAFNKLNLTRANWVDLPVEPKFKLPAKSSEDTPWTADDFRSEDFEDIPTYMYTGGLIDMHDHVFISGLLYVPQALELEAKNSNGYAAYQYIIGSIVVRDGFYIEANDSDSGNFNSVTVISTDPMSFSNILITGTAAQQTAIDFGQSIQDKLASGTPGSSPASGDLIVGLPGSGGGNSGGNNPGANNLPPAAAWTEIVPVVPANLP